MDNNDDRWESLISRQALIWILDSVYFGADSTQNGNWNFDKWIYHQASTVLFHDDDDEKNHLFIVS